MAEKISYVIPCYNSQETLTNVIEEVTQVTEQKLKEFEFEFVLVNDCSKDNTIGVIRKLCSDHSNITGIDFSKNFGQHAALLAGFHKVSGDFIVCLDDDGQMPIESIPDLIKLLKDDTDCVIGKYQEVKQTTFRQFGSWVNKKMTEFLLSKPKELVMNSFWGARRFVIDEMIKYEGAYPHIGGLLLRTTSNIKNIDVKHRERAAGSSNYTFIRLIKLWMNGFTAFSEKPLRISTFFGFISAFVGFVLAVIMVIKKLVNPDVPLGYTSIVCLILFIGGLLMLLMGMMGEYIGRTYLNINRSPQYVIRKEYHSPDKDGQKDISGSGQD
ncbi:MAG: glycosyltransferase family 2 protein [Ruminococcus sp.]|nr:glycosyltransferase family 2 protein [Ruminococcus sp.]